MDDINNSETRSNKSVSEPVADAVAPAPALVVDQRVQSQPAEQAEVPPEYRAHVIGPGDRYPYWVIISSKVTWLSMLLLFIGVFFLVTPGLPVSSNLGGGMLVVGILLMAGVIAAAMRIGHATHHVCEPLEDRFVFRTGFFGRQHIIPFAEIVGMTVVGGSLRESLHGGSVVFVTAKTPTARRRKVTINGIENTDLFRRMILKNAQQQKRHA